MKSISMMISSSKTAVILIDFSISLNLRSKETDNCIINNHSILDIFFILNNFRTIKLKYREKTYLHDTDVCTFFSYSISISYFYKNYLHYILQYDNKIRVDKGLILRAKFIY